MCGTSTITGHITCLNVIICSFHTAHDYINKTLTMTLNTIYFNTVTVLFSCGMDYCEAGVNPFKKVRFSV